MSAPTRPGQGLLSLILLAVALLCTVGSVVAAHWVDDLDVLVPVLLMSLVLGYIVSRIPAPGSLLHPLGLLAGSAAAFYMVASTLPKAPEGIARLSLLWNRLATWLVVVTSGGFGNEPVLFLLLLALGTFIAGYVSTWSVYRERSAWFPLILGGAGLVVNVSYAPELLDYVLPFAVASVLLISRVNVVRRELLWREAGVNYESGIWNATMRAGLAVAIGVSAFGWYAPEIPPRDDVNNAVYEASQPLRELQVEFNRVFGGVRGRGPAPPALSGFGNSMTLGGQFRLANYSVLSITSPEARYWRAVAYERYTGQGWVVGQPSTPLRLQADVSLPVPKYDQRVELTQQVEVLQPRGDYLVGASVPLRVDLPVNAEAVGSQFAQFGRQRRATQDVSADSIVALRGGLAPGTHYTVVSWVSHATPEMLRRAGRDYPREVMATYTRLPSVPQTVRDLAISLTSAHDNPYDKARAVEDYLRTIPYSLDVAPPPPNRDGVEYFLFEAQTGYCDYFASAMAVMLRSVGVPARVVSGYATGTQVSADGPFVVRDSNAHSWVEVFFPRYGWIEFDPSSSQPRIEHPAGVVQPTPTAEAIPTMVAGPGSEVPEPDDPSRDFATGEYPFLGSDSNAGLRAVAIALAVVALAAASVMVLWQASLSGLSPSAAAYARVTQLASVLGWRPRPAETPHEYSRRLAGLAPDDSGSIRLIAEAFVAFRFGRRATSPGERDILASAWENVRRGLLVAAKSRARAVVPPWPRRGGAA